VVGEGKAGLRAGEASIVTVELSSKNRWGYYYYYYA